VIISAFGLPPLAHEKDAYLATVAAMKFREEFTKGVIFLFVLSRKECVLKPSSFLCLDLASTIFSVHRFYDWRHDRERVRRRGWKRDALRVCHDWSKYQELLKP
jgi:hypothetical protein